MNPLKKTRKDSRGERILTCFHLPDVGGSVRAPDDEEVVERPPLDGGDWEDVSRGQHDGPALLERQQRHRVVGGHRAHAKLDPGAGAGRRNVQRCHLAGL